MKLLHSFVVVLVLASATVASAEAILFTDRSAFEAALTGDVVGNIHPGLHAGLSDIRYGGTLPPGQWFGGYIGYHAYFFNSFMSTAPVTAVGFDFVNRKTFSDTGPVPPAFLNVPFYDPNDPTIPDLLFTFKTAGGAGSTNVIPLNTFLGVMLFDDVFSDLDWGTNANCGFCISLFVLDKLTIQTGTTVSETAQAVPEPMTAALLGLGVLGIVLARRRV